MGDIKTRNKKRKMEHGQGKYGEINAILALQEQNCYSRRIPMLLRNINIGPKVTFCLLSLYIDAPCIKKQMNVHTIVLYHSRDDITWAPVATNSLLSLWPQVRAVTGLCQFLFFKIRSRRLK